MVTTTPDSCPAASTEMVSSGNDSPQTGVSSVTRSGLGAASLIDGDVYENGARLHEFEHAPGDEARCAGAWNEHGADDEIDEGKLIEERGFA